MNHTSNTSEKKGSDSNSAVSLNPSEVAKGIETINSFVQAIYKDSQNDPKLFGWLLENPRHLLQILNSYSELKERCKDLEKKLSQAATVIGTKDTGAKAISGVNHYELSQQYQILKGDFESVSVQIFDFFHQLKPSFATSNRHKKIAEIQRNLSEIILIDNFFPKPDLFKSHKIDQTSKEISSLIVSSSGIAEFKNQRLKQILLREREEKLNGLIKNSLQQVLIDGLTTLTKLSDPASNCPEIIKAVEDWISQDLTLKIKAHPTLNTSINQLADKGVTFVMNLTKATPAGRLWIEEKDTEFDRDKHQPHQMCGESKIEFTIFPGYSIDSVIFHKALVFTK